MNIYMSEFDRSMTYEIPSHVCFYYIFTSAIFLTWTTLACKIGFHVLILKVTGHKTQRVKIFCSPKSLINSYYQRGNHLFRFSQNIIFLFALRSSLQVMINLVRRNQYCLYVTDSIIGPLFSSLSPQCFLIYTQLAITTHVI